MYKVRVTTRFERVFKKLEKRTQQQILTILNELAEDPFNHPNSRSIVGVKEKAFRVRMGRWRVLYIVMTKEQVLEVIDLFMKKGPSDYQKRM